MQQRNKIEQIELKRHSLAHLLAIAVLKKFPSAKLGIGPIIENGFYYDFQAPRNFTPEDLIEFEKEMRELIKNNIPFKGEKITPVSAKKLFKTQKFKLDLISEFVKDKKQLKIYKTGDIFSDLCQGGHIKKTSEINPDSFKLTKTAGAYWRGNEKNPQMQRIYGLAFETKKELDEYVKRMEDAEKRDHKKLGPELDLFTFSDLVGSGLPLWTPKGTLIRNILEETVWQLRKECGYMRVEIPHITKKDLYEKSGHWEKFKDELFKIVTREGHLFAMKPMSCPHHTQIYARKKWSYRELPQRYENTTMVYRDEQSGELAGLSRVRSITQDDAHVFCRSSQVKEEFLKVWNIIHKFYSPFGFNLKVRLSLHDPKHPENYLGDKKRWKEAEDILREIVKEKNADSFDGVGEAAFYGPKLDFTAKDSIGREWQIATIQLDMNMPERFDLTCINEEGKPERIVMIHAAIMGSIERFLSIIIEHFAGEFPLWLSPVQVKILPISAEKHMDYAKKICNEFSANNIRAEIDEANESLGKKIRLAEMAKTPYILVVGDKEAVSESVSVRHYHRGQEGEIKVDALIKKLIEEIDKKTI
jgi:threonyl-tRNA synthetase